MNLTVQQLDKKLLKGEMINGFYLDSDKETVKQKPFSYKDVMTSIRKRLCNMSKEQL